MSDAPETEDEKIVAKLSEYLDKTLPADERAAVEARVAADAEWKRVHDDLVEQRKLISAMRKAAAPPRFTANVTSTIHQRSAGRFFGFGYRVPFGALLVVALAALGVIAWLMWTSPTGSLKRERGDFPESGSGELVPNSVKP
jgi:anti-sigma factor RsiW